ncbi:type V CRISPR-associated protein Cas12a/Cpf1 [Pseudobutyrivibrio xylanivorans]|uniref:CRISPR-associated protein Cpf1, subtype PREFRAN n=1 Tax=Pseudobutyrivibrio xylanivorans TaxID=185007 RepID=A0A1G5RS09_PSEXY|nr:type V CRISPR-associated protein Cas12a/Cpf1 [Pseudobutyrivibrio xylanivorans]SCZ76797.1 CRISPR-associated protein Cpf1, subtype PREFRAN [Pseudobutyrivibrio xylanivorans]
MYYQNLTKMYPISKTLRNELIPVGKTLENIRKNGILEADIQRKADYEHVKKLMDNYHKQLINEALQGVHLSDLSDAYDLYFNLSKEKNSVDAFSKCQDKLRKEIVSFLKNHENFPKIGNKEIIKLIQSLNDNDADNNALDSFSNFYTYFSSYNEVRKNLYSDEEKSSTVAYRLINENLPKSLDNIKAYAIAKKAGVRAEGLSEEEQDCLFIIETFERTLTQDGIDNYNADIGKLNTAINLYNQQNKKQEGFRKVPQMKCLYKQILSDREEAFIDEFSDDEDLITNIESFAENMNVFLNSEIITDFKNALVESDGSLVYIKNDVSKTLFSNIVFGSWNAIDEKLSDEYDLANSKKKKDEKYYEKRQKELKKNKSYDLETIIGLFDDSIDVIGKYIEKLESDITAIAEAKNDFDEIVLRKHDKNKSLRKNTNAVEAIKSYLDTVKDFERDIKLINGSGQEVEKNLVVYAEQENILAEIKNVDSLYNMSRNYLTQKPFSTEKFKLNFENPTLLNGWDRNKEKDYLGILFEKEGMYYLGIINNNHRKIFENEKLCTGKESCFNKIVYKQISNAAKYLSSKQINPQNPPKEIAEILLKRKADSSSLSRKETELFIDYLKDDFLVNYPMIINSDGENFFNFHFKQAKDYGSLQEFFKEVEHQAYSLKTRPIDDSYIYRMIDEGKLYLFQIHNKDFSPYSKGNLNLHTIYLQMLFDQRNLNNVVYKLNGEAEVFYRPASINDEEVIIHKAGEEIKNKNSKRAVDKPTSKFGYDIIKDRRYSKDKFMLHIPVTMNFGVDETRRFNDVVNDALRNDEKVRVIGIDRGERNLLYVVVVDTDGTILEQISLNSIINNEYSIETDYHKLLDEKEGDRDRARKNWTTIENIKELKEGYLSQVVNVIAKLVLKYNAIICLEDLNFGFKRGRQKVEKQVYQKFEKMLIDKLNYLVIDKSRKQEKPEEFGGALNALQLTSKFTSFKDMGKQTGIIYYVPAYLTSKIDPTTGFANLFYVKYENVEKAKEFFSRFDSISYNNESGYFEFAFDYKKFTDRACGARSQWTVCTYGERIIKYRNADKNNSFDDKTIVLSEEFKELFSIYGISYEDGAELKNKIMSVDEADFFRCLTGLLQKTLQMRNSSNDGTRDYIISPIMNDRGEFFNSEACDASKPKDADANGAFNIARKGLWVLEQIRNTPSGDKLNLAMSNAEWLEYAQRNQI